MDVKNQHTITAFFRDRSDAEGATRKLADAGIAESGIRLVPGKEPDSVAGTDIDERMGFWEALGEFFFPADDREVYAEGLRRGGYLVTVSNLTDDQHQTALDILDDEGTIDVDEWSESWRAEGWAPTNPGFDPRTAQAPATTEDPLAAERQTRREEQQEVRREEEVIGRRDFDASGNRVKSYIYDKPERQMGTPPRV